MRQLAEFSALYRVSIPAGLIVLGLIMGVLGVLGFVGSIKENPKLIIVVSI
jgi:hypothetical protein